ncbi:MAG: glutamate 5-kinase [Clostridia bacterium]|nr:glutamate 5-kinase [Clostridia bacterium]
MNIIKDAKRIVFKIGSSTLTHDTGRLNLERMETLVRIFSDFKNAGKEIVLVSSGAVSAGIARLKLDQRPDTIEGKQAAAAVGQSELMRMYERFFSMYGHTVGQMLLTKDVVDSETLKHNAQNTFRALLSMGCVPIINENDSISCEELKFGGNDTLSAYVALLCEADVLINLSDIDGLYDSNPRTNPGAKLIQTVPVINEKIFECAGGAGTERGTGGMITKLKAAQIVCGAGIPMFILNGHNPGTLYDLFEGRSVGTYFMSN